MLHSRFEARSIKLKRKPVPVVVRNGKCHVLVSSDISTVPPDVHVINTHAYYDLENLDVVDTRIRETFRQRGRALSFAAKPLSVRPRSCRLGKTKKTPESGTTTGCVTPTPTTGRGLSFSDTAIKIPHSKSTFSSPPSSPGPLPVALSRHTHIRPLSASSRPISACSRVSAISLSAMSGLGSSTLPGSSACSSRPSSAGGFSAAPATITAALPVSLSLESVGKEIHPYALKTSRASRTLPDATRSTSDLAPPPNRLLSCPSSESVASYAERTCVSPARSLPSGACGVGIMNNSTRRPHSAPRRPLSAARSDGGSSGLIRRARPQSAVTRLHAPSASSHPSHPPSVSHSRSTSVDSSLSLRSLLSSSTRPASGGGPETTPTAQPASLPRGIARSSQLSNSGRRPLSAGPRSKPLSPQRRPLSAGATAGRLSGDPFAILHELHPAVRSTNYRNKRQEAVTEAVDPTDSGHGLQRLTTDTDAPAPNCPDPLDPVPSIRDTPPLDANLGPDGQNPPNLSESGFGVDQVLLGGPYPNDPGGSSEGATSNRCHPNEGTTDESRQSCPDRLASSAASAVLSTGGTPKTPYQRRVAEDASVEFAGFASPPVLGTLPLIAASAADPGVPRVAVPTETNSTADCVVKNQSAEYESEAGVSADKASGTGGASVDDANNASVGDTSENPVEAVSGSIDSSAAFRCASKDTEGPTRLSFPDDVLQGGTVGVVKDGCAPTSTGVVANAGGIGATAAAADEFGRDISADAFSASSVDTYAADVMNDASTSDAVVSQKPALANSLSQNSLRSVEKEESTEMDKLTQELSAELSLAKLSDDVDLSPRDDPLALGHHIVSPGGSKQAQGDMVMSMSPGTGVGAWSEAPARISLPQKSNEAKRGRRVPRPQSSPDFLSRTNQRRSRSRTSSLSGLDTASNSTPPDPPTSSSVASHSSAPSQSPIAPPQSPVVLSTKLVGEAAVSSVALEGESVSATPSARTMEQGTLQSPSQSHQRKSVTAGTSTDAMKAHCRWELESTSEEGDCVPFLVYGAALHARVSPKRLTSQRPATAGPPVSRREFDTDATSGSKRRNSDSSRPRAHETCTDPDKSTLVNHSDVAPKLPSSPAATVLPPSVHIVHTASESSAELLHSAGVAPLSPTRRLSPLIRQRSFESPAEGTCLPLDTEECGLFLTAVSLSASSMLRETTSSPEVDASKRAEGGPKKTRPAVQNGSDRFFSEVSSETLSNVVRNGPFYSPVEPPPPEIDSGDYNLDHCTPPMPTTAVNANHSVASENESFVPGVKENIVHEGKIGKESELSASKSPIRQRGTAAPLSPFQSPHVGSPDTTPIHTSYEYIRARSRSLSPTPTLASQSLSVLPDSPWDLSEGQGQRSSLYSLSIATYTQPSSPVVMRSLLNLSESGVEKVGFADGAPSPIASGTSLPDAATPTFATRETPQGSLHVMGRGGGPRDSVAGSPQTRATPQPEALGLSLTVRSSNLAERVVLPRQRTPGDRPRVAGNAGRVASDRRERDAIDAMFSELSVGEAVFDDHPLPMVVQGHDDLDSYSIGRPSPVSFSEDGDMTFCLSPLPLQPPAEASWSPSVVSPPKGGDNPSRRRSFSRARKKGHKRRSFRRAQSAGSASTPRSIPGASRSARGNDAYSDLDHADRASHGSPKNISAGHTQTDGSPGREAAAAVVPPKPVQVEVSVSPQPSKERLSEVATRTPLATIETQAPQDAAKFSRLPVGTPGTWTFTPLVSPSPYSHRRGSGSKASDGFLHSSGGVASRAVSSEEIRARSAHLLQDDGVAGNTRRPRPHSASVRGTQPAVRRRPSTADPSTDPSTRVTRPAIHRRPSTAGPSIVSSSEPPIAAAANAPDLSIQGSRPLPPRPPKHFARPGSAGPSPSTRHNSAPTLNGLGNHVPVSTSDVEKGWTASPGLDALRIEPRAAVSASKAVSSPETR
eukprot:Rmarinus@m.24052